MAEKSNRQKQNRRHKAGARHGNESPTAVDSRDPILADRMAATTTLASGMAHEINNPLTYVMGNMELIQRVLRDGPPPPEQVAALREAAAEALAGAERIRDLVATLRAFAEEDPTVFRPADLGQVVDHTVRMLRNHHQNRVRISADFGDAPSVGISEARLGQLCMSLLRNAVQALPGDRAHPGSVSISVGSDPSGHATLTVRDNGRGMTPADQARALDPFFTTKEPGLGTGLGLTICHDIITKAGGTISVASDGDVGTTVVVRLPPATGASAPAKESAPTTDDADAPNILVINDDPATRTLTQLPFSSFRLTSVAGGVEALERCRRHPYAVILCELTLPEMSGLTFYRKLAEACPGMERRIIFLSGAPSTEKVRAFLSASQAPVLYKPFSLSELMEAISSAPVSPASRVEARATSPRRRRPPRENAAHGCTGP